MNDTTSNDRRPEQTAPEIAAARRRLLKALGGAGAAFAGGQALPQRWTRPLVDSVLLPAHAQATGPGTVTSRSYAGPVTPVASGGGPGPAPIVRLLDLLVPPAHATAFPIETATLCATVTGTAFSATLLLSNTNGCGTFTGSGTVGGGFATLSGSSSVFMNLQLQVPAATAASLSYNLNFDQYGSPFSDTGTINLGACSLTGSECIPGP